MQEKVYRVRAYWDAEACWWVAESDDVPGLATGAKNIDDLIANLRTLVPELLELNGVLSGGDEQLDVPFEFTALYEERIRMVS